MIWLPGVQLHEMPAVVRQQNTLLVDSKCQHIVVRKPLSRSAALVSRQNIMPQPSKLIDNRKRKVLIRVDMSHPLRLLILGNLPVDFLSM